MNNFLIFSTTFINLYSKEKFLDDYKEDIDSLPYFSKLKLFRNIGETESIYNILKDKGQASFIYGFIDDKTNVDFLIKYELELSHVLKEKMDLIYSYIIEDAIKNKDTKVEKNYLYKQLEVRQKYNLSTMYKALFYLGKFYYFSRLYPKAKNFFESSLSELKKSNINDGKIYYENNKFLNKIKEILNSK